MDYLIIFSSVADKKPIKIYINRKGSLVILVSLIKYPDKDRSMQRFRLANADLKETVLRGSIKQVRALLARPGIDVNQQYHDGWTVLLYLVFNECTDRVAVLLAHDGINVNYQNHSGVTALMFAASFGYHTIVTQLLACEGLDVNQQDNSGQTALMRAVHAGYLEIVQQLLDHSSIDITLKNREGNTAEECMMRLEGPYNDRVEALKELFESYRTCPYLK